MRKHYTAEKRAELIELVTTKSTSIREAARQLGVRPSTAYHWIRKSVAERSLEKRAARTPVNLPREPVFLELRRERAAESTLEVRIGAASLVVRHGFDAELLRAVVSALGGAS